MLGGLATITGHSRVFFNEINAYRLYSSSSGGVLFASYAEVVSVKNSNFYNLVGSGGAPIDIRSVAETVEFTNNTFGLLMVESFMYISSSPFNFTRNSVQRVET